MVFMKIIQLFGYGVLIAIAAIVLTVLIAFILELWKAFFGKKK